MKASLFHQVVREFERRYLLVELHRNNWNRAETARELGLPYRTLLKKLEVLDLNHTLNDAEEVPASELVSA
jgi:DNA-binding NtrC family response regulator